MTQATEAQDSSIRQQHFNMYRFIWFRHNREFSKEGTIRQNWNSARCTHTHTTRLFAYSCLNSMLYQWVLAGKNSCLCMAFDDCMVVCLCLIVLAILQSCRSMLFCRILFCTGILRHFNQWTTLSTLSAFSLTTKKIFKDKMADHETVWF